MKTKLFLCLAGMIMLSSFFICHPKQQARYRIISKYHNRLGAFLNIHSSGSKTRYLMSGTNIYGPLKGWVDSPVIPVGTNLLIFFTDEDDHPVFHALDLNNDSLSSIKVDGIGLIRGLGEYMRITNGASQDTVLGMTNSIVEFVHIYDDYKVHLSFNLSNLTYSVTNITN